ncbi:MAG: hypothetical protein K0M40_22090 [Prolixibacteraceae bacterium]|nr:hypothetical protein [Prolixibacteraceae bacterium]
MKQKTFKQLQTGIESFRCWYPDFLAGRHPSIKHEIFSKKTSVQILFSLILMVLCGTELIGQESVVTFDTIRLERSGSSDFDYLVFNSKIKTIGFNKSQFKVRKDDHFTVAGEVGRGMLTLLTGIGTGATKEVSWHMAGKISADYQKLNWDVDIYCPGSITKSKERVRNDDGSFSTENSRENEINWDRSLGFIKNQSDTLGRFCVVMGPRSAPELKKWTTEVYKTEPAGMKGLINSKIEFALWGDLLGQENLIIYNSDENLLYVYKGKELRGIFQPEQKKILVRKKKIKQPFLLVNNALSEDVKTEVLFLAMIGQWFIYSNKEPV